MAIVLATFILAVQEILYLVYFALLFINDRSELNSLVAKNASILHREHRTAQTNNEQRALLLSLLFLRIIEFGKVG